MDSQAKAVAAAAEAWRALAASADLAPADPEVPAAQVARPLPSHGVAQPSQQ
jgi:hypothetical protein